MSKGEQTRASILDVSLQLASRTGFEALTIGRLAERTEMSKSGLFAHFRSKEQLQVQTLERARERLMDVVVRPTLGAPRGEPRLRRLFDAWLAWEQDGATGGCIFVAASVEYDDQPGPVRDELVRHQRDWSEFITTVVGTGVSEGHFRDDLDARQLAFALQGLMLGYHHAHRLLGDPDALERTRTSFEQLLQSAR